MVKLSTLPEEIRIKLKQLDKFRITGPCTLPQSNIKEIIETARRVRITPAPDNYD